MLILIVVLILLAVFILILKAYADKKETEKIAQLRRIKEIENAEIRQKAICFYSEKQKMPHL